MNLTFSLLVVDDEPDVINQSIIDLEDFLDKEGFALKKQEEKISTKEDFKKFTIAQSANYDLVIVDYRLGKDLDGDDIVRKFKEQLPYTEMLFYSASPVNKLLQKIYEAEVSGVFVANRNVLSSELTGLANMIIRKVVDLNNMRGIAMTEVAAMDLRMTETLELIFHNKCNEQIKKERKKIINKLLKDVRKEEKDLKEYEQNNFAGLINNNQLFTLFKKFETLLRLSKDLPEENKNDLELLSDYKKEIIKKRNLLAHVKETTRKNGKVILRAGKNDEIINDKWMKSFRKSLKQHSEALCKICKAVEDKYKNRNVENDSQES